MKILSYEYSEPNFWHFDKINFDNINLIVGKNGSGKTRLVNTIVNFFNMFSSNQETIRNGSWVLTFKINDADLDIYTYEFKAENFQIVLENLKKGNEFILQRNSNKIIIEKKEILGFNNKIISLKAFAENKTLSKIFHVFNNVFLRRHNPFVYDKFGFELVSYEKLNAICNSKSTFEEYLSQSRSVLPEIGFYYLKMHSPDLLNELKNCFRAYFDFVEDIDLRSFDTNSAAKFPDNNQNNMYTLCIKENSTWIPSFDISSGMTKYLESLVDIYSIPSNSVIIYDEFENGLDPFNVTQLMDVFLENRKDRQYIFTSHHPNIINNFPIKNWIVLNRHNYNVKNYNGEKIEKDTTIKGGFISLINSKLYTGE
jgi:energy-coupling factor transporter ATP-binding protein EcfA2